MARTGKRKAKGISLDLHLATVEECMAAFEG